ncbi:DUF3592 domain-containing protein [Amycolatopsis sp. NPDC051903]|uniref:DUF3592 domain-containing protein n=1 Tax=Amycolatopsis sp. NPDC051903 TaxID=3363936 RepID=UPI0037B55080
MLTGFWTAGFAAGLLGVLGALHAADDLLVTGTRVPGTVVGVDSPDTGTRSIVVAFTADGREVSERIDRSSPATYASGQRVTVVFDPADLERARTTEEDGLNDTGLGFAWTGLVLVAGCALVAASAAAGWSRRHHAVRRTGWRAATATVVLAPSTGRGLNPPYLDARLASGEAVRLRAAPSTHGARFLRVYTDRPAWLGGSGAASVVLFRHGRGEAPYAVPAGVVDPRAQD